MDDLIVGMGTRRSWRSRPCSSTAAYEGLTLIFGFSTRSGVSTARTTHQRPLSPFQTLRREAPKRQNPDGVIMTLMTQHGAFYIYVYITTSRDVRLSEVRPNCFRNQKAVIIHQKIPFNMVRAPCAFC